MIQENNIQEVIDQLIKDGLIKVVGENDKGEKIYDVVRQENVSKEMNSTLVLEGL